MDDYHKLVMSKNRQFVTNNISADIVDISKQP